MNKYLIIVLVLLGGYFVFKPKSDTPVVNEPPPAAIAAQTPAAAAPSQPECISPAQLEAMKKQCTPDGAKVEVERLKAQLDSLEKQVADGFNDLAANWEKNKDRRQDERSVIVNRIKSEVLAACPGAK